MCLGVHYLELAELLKHELRIFNLPNLTVDILTNDSTDIEILSVIEGHRDLVPNIIDAGVLRPNPKEMYIIVKSNNKFVGYMEFTSDVLSMEGKGYSYIVKGLLPDVDLSKVVLLSRFYIESNYRSIGIGGVLKRTTDAIILHSGYIAVVGLATTNKAAKFYERNNSVIYDLTVSPDNILKYFIILNTFYDK